jgi:two-component system, OmpR family, response regulator MprA
VTAVSTAEGRSPLTVLVADDEPAVRLSLSRALALERYSVVCASDGLEALDVVAEGNVDLVILDVGMPGLDGLSTCRKMRERGDTTPVLILTARNRMIDTVVGLDAGADDYLAKPFDLDVLYARLRSLIRRSQKFNVGVVEVNDLVVDSRHHTVRRAGARIELTPREFRLVELLAKHAGEVLHRDWILEQLWGAESDASSNALDVFVASVRRKLETENPVRILHTIRGVGYTLGGDPAR